MFKMYYITKKNNKYITLNFYFKTVLKTNNLKQLLNLFHCVRILFLKNNYHMFQQNCIEQPFDTNEIRVSQKGILMEEFLFELKQIYQKIESQLGQFFFKLNYYLNSF